MIHAMIQARQTRIVALLAAIASALWGFSVGAEPPAERMDIRYVVLDERGYTRADPR